MEIWSRVLGIEEQRISIDSNFFRLGGHSLNAAIVISKIHKVLNVKLPLVELFNSPTVRGLSAIIAEAAEAGHTTIEPVEKREYYYLSSAQMRLFILHQMEPNHTNYNMWQSLLLEGTGESDVDIIHLEHIFHRLIQRHESMRTSFEIIEDGPVQRIHDQVEFKIESLEGTRGRSPQFAASTIKNFVRPFDLSRAPLLRVGLVKLEEKKYLLITDAHHIISDGASYALLVQDFMALYSGIELTGIRIQYKDYTGWQNKEKESASIKQQEEYWLNQFPGEIPLLNLPIDYPRPPTQSFEGETLYFEIGEKCTKELKSLALEKEVTLFMLFLSITNILLLKLSTQEDIVVGTPAAARRHVDLQPIIGMFVNTLALRNKPSGKKIFNTFLKEIKEKTLAAFENQEYPFEELVEKVSITRDASRNPLFDVMLVIQNVDIAELEIPGLKLKPYEPENRISKFDITLQVVESEAKLLLTLEYCTKLFRKETIHRFIKYLKNIVSSILDDPGQKISQVEILPEEEKNRILYEFNDTAVEYPRGKTIHQLFTEQVEQTPDHISVIGMEHGSWIMEKHLKGTRGLAPLYITYRELNKRSDQLALYLKEKGVKPDTIVGIMLKRSVDMIIGILAILKAGGAYMPIDADYPEDRINFMLGDTRSKVLLAAPETQAKVKAEVEKRFIEIIDISNHPSLSTLTLTSTCQVSPPNLAYVIYTSGSTGKPKGVLVEHASVVNLAYSQKNRFDMNEKDRVLQFSTICFDASVEQIFIALFSGAVLVLIDKVTLMDSSKFETYISNHSITHIHAVPSFLENMRLKDTSQLKRVISGGDVCPVVLARKWCQCCDFYNEYGPTETTVTSIEIKVELVEETLPRLPIGSPINNTTVYLFDQWLKPVPLGVIGELYIGGAGVARGYLNAPELTAEKFLPDSYMSHMSYMSYIYKTGDLARWLWDGELEYLGRIDQQVKIRGFRIEPGEIENRLLHHDEIKETVVLAKEDENNEKYLCAYVVSNNAIPVSELREYLSKGLPDYMIPAYFVRIRKIPLTSNGKIDRKALPVPELQTGENYTAPGDEIEKQLVKIWAQILGRDALHASQLHESIGIHDNFFELGGHSLKATIMAVKIHKALNVKIPLAEIFVNPTIKRLAQTIKAAAVDKYASIKAAEEKEYHELSSAQKRLYILQQMEPGITSYHISGAFELEGVPDIAKLEETFKQLIQRHESFRTSFQLVKGTPVQRIHDHVQFESESLEGTRGLAPLSIAATAFSNPQSATALISSFIRPFDLAQPPLLRVGLRSQEGRERKYILMVDMHHIISDGSSMGVFIKDLMTLYRGEALPGLRIRYKDYSQWHNQAKDSGAINRQETYWLNQLAGEIPVLNLPLDYVRPQVQSFEGKTLHFEFQEECTASLKSLALKEEVTLFMLLLAIINVLLTKLSGQEEIIVGMPVAARRHADLEEIIGMFVNTLVLWNKPVGNKPFNTFLKEVKEKTLNAYENQEYPFEDLVEKVSAPRHVSRNPLFDVIFALQNMEVNEIEIPGLTLKPYQYENKTSKFDLTIIGAETGNKLLFTVEYCTKLFKEETILRFITYFKNLVSSIIDNWKREISGISFIPEQEKQQMLYEFNDTRCGETTDKTLHELFMEQAERTPDHISVIGMDHGAWSMEKHLKGTRGLAPLYITYKELNKRSDQLALHLKGKGVKPDTIVAIMVERSIEMIIGLLGILKAGGAYLPIELGYPEDRINYMLSDSSAKLLVTTSILAKEGERARSWEGEKIFIDLENRLACSTFGNSPLERGAPKGRGVSEPAANLAYIIYTSGTTGKPKGNLTTHANVIRVVKDTNYIELTGNDRILQLSNYAFDGSVFDIYGALLNGSVLVLVDRERVLELDRLAALIRQQQITAFFVTTALFNTLIDMQIDCFAHVKKVLFGGERVSLEHARKALEYLGKGRVIHVYGPTETTVYATYYFIDRIEEGAVTVPIGLPITNTTAYILDAYLQLVPIGVTGEFYIGGEGLARGYLNQPELTAEKFDHDLWDYWDYHDKKEAHELTRIRIIPNQKFLQWGPGGAVFSKSAPPGRRRQKIYKTGDLVRRLLDGNIEFIGRIDGQIKIRGFRIELGEVESRLLGYNEIKEAVVLARENESGEKYLCAYFVSNNHIPGSGLREYLSKALPDYMIPSYFLQLEKIPLTPNGKVDRKALPEPEFKTEEDYAAPRNEIEERLVGIWQEVLGLEPVEFSKIGIDDNFFELGGHSLKATILISKIHKMFNVKIPLVEIFKKPTIRGLSGYISGAGDAGEDKYVSIKKAEKKEYYPLSLAQQRFYILHQLNPGTLAFNIPVQIPLAEDIDEERLEKALCQLIRRHESLRTSFEIIDDQPVQRIHEGNYKLQITRYPAGAPDKDGAVHLEPAARSSQVVTSIITNFIRPFDLSQAPLLRIGLIKAGNGKHILLVDMHHIISDGFSTQLLLRDFLALYAGKELPRLRLQYKDFSGWQNQQIQSVEMKKHEEYWLNHLNGHLPVLNLPYDYPRQDHQSYKGNTITISLGQELTGQVNRLMQETGTTLFMVLLAAYTILLSRYSGSKDIIIGSPIARRNHADVENIIGLLIGAVMMRNFPESGKPFINFLTEVRKNTLDAYEHQAYPFEELLKKLDYEEEPGLNPISRVELIVQNIFDSSSSNPSNWSTLFDLSHSHSQEDYSFNTSKLDLSLIAFEQAGDIILNFAYSTDLFKAQTIERFAGYLVTLLGQVVEHPGIMLSDLDIVSPGEKRMVIGSIETCYPLSHAQKRIYYLEKIYPNTACHTLTFSIRYNEILARPLLEKAINQAILKNDGLRLRIVEFDIQEEPLQYISSFEPYPLKSVEEDVQQWIEADVGKPFQLINGRLFDFAYLKFNEKQSGYYMKLHHIVSDGWTHLLLAAEINGIYWNLKSGKPIDNTLPPSYIHYINHEKEYLRSFQAQKDREFWFNTLLPLPEEVHLSSLKKENENPRDISAISTIFNIPNDLRTQLHQYCKNRGTSIYKVLLCALSVYIYRVTGIDDVVIGSANHGRASASHKRTVGMFVSTIPLRIKTGHTMDFRGFVEKTGQEVNHILKNHQKYPFDRLSTELKGVTGVDPGYLLNISLIGHPDMKEGKFKMRYHFPGYESTPLTIHINAANRDIHGVLELEWVYQPGRFSDEDIPRMHQGLVNILKDALNHPGKKLPGIELVSKEEKEKILYQFNDTASTVLYPEDKVVNQLFEEQVKRTPDHISVIGMGHGAWSMEKHLKGTRGLGVRRTQPIKENVSITYRELNRKSNQLAYLLKEKGVKPDTIVGVMVERSVEMIIGLLGILKAGSAYLPIEPDYPEERINYMLADSSAKLLVTTSILAKEGERARRWEGEKIFIDVENRLACPTFGNSPLERGAPKGRGVSKPAANLAYIIYTSGTTGKPKGVVVEHGNLITYLNAFANEFQLHANDIVIQQASFAFDAFVEEMYPVLIKGGRLAIPAKKDIQDMDRLSGFIAKHNVTMITCSPLMLNELNQRPLISGSSIRIFISGGDRLKASYVDRLVQMGNAVVYNTYGPTETTVCASYYRCSSLDNVGSPGVSIGKPITNYRVYILDSYGNLLPVGVTGELCVTGAGVARGYLNHPEMTAEKFDRDKRKKVPGKRINRSYKSYRSYISKKIYKTGDLARWQWDGTIEFIGRIDGQVKIRGFRIELEEIESQLSGHTEIDQAVVLSKEDQTAEKYLCAYFVSRRAIPVSELRDYLLKALPDYMIPAYFVRLEEIPLTANGKVDRKALPVPELQPGENYAAPGDEIEKQLVKIWAQIIGRDALHASQSHASQLHESIGIHDNFFELGGHSLKATIMAAKIHKTLNVKIPLAEIFTNPTIKKLAQTIKAGAANKYTSISPAEKKEYYLLSSSQERLYMLQQMKTEAVIYNMPGVFLLEGKINRKKLEQIFYRLINRHESLRTCFILLAGEIYQGIRQSIDFEIEYHSAGCTVQGPGRRARIIQDFIRPFDLGKPPLLRVGLIKISPQEHIFMMDMHHIISDGSSQSLLVKELMALYAKETLPGLRIQYKDYSEWQYNNGIRKMLKIQEEYWLKEFAGDVPVLNLPTDFTRPGTMRFEGSMLDFDIHRQESKALKKIAIEEEVSLFGLLLAILNVLISKITGQDDISIGTQVAGRKHTDLDNIIGVFLNTLVLRNDLDKNNTFKGFLHQVMERTLQAFENQDYPFEDLVKKVIGKREISRNPLFDVMLVWQNFETNEIKIPTLNLKPYHYEHKSRALIDLSLYGFELEGKLSFTFEYSTELFKKESIERFINYFKEIISTVTANKEIKLKDIKISHHLGMAAPGVSREEDDQFGF
ncbi:MAG: amino acid adenylation domain-containing protein [Candidatus Aminicenantes bacterium]|nr:MAG: amino acid adenylation domain-containing protein [Candidatus Aminicenantes bacterium]